jgi:hypothetical protein
LFNKHGKLPADLAEMTIPQTIAVLNEPKNELSSDGIECNSMAEAIEITKRLQGQENAQDEG